MLNIGDACVFLHHTCVVLDASVGRKKTLQVAFFLRPISSKNDARVAKRARLRAFFRASRVASPTQGGAMLVRGMNIHYFNELGQLLVPERDAARVRRDDLYIYHLSNELQYPFILTLHHHRQLPHQQRQPCQQRDSAKTHVPHSLSARTKHPNAAQIHVHPFAVQIHVHQLFVKIHANKLIPASNKAMFVKKDANVERSDKTFPSQVSSSPSENGVTQMASDNPDEEMICTDAQNLCESDPGPDEEGSEHNVDPHSQTVTPVSGNNEEDDDETEIPDWNKNLTFCSGQEKVGSEDDRCQNTQDDDDEVVDPTYCQPPVRQSMRSAEEVEEDASDESDDEPVQEECRAQRWRTDSCRGLRDRWSLESCLCDSSPATKQRRCSDPDRCRYRCSVA
ncbi:unnamed protein product [Ranitomeya imitator]|uniref:Uncharacterized protein n=1 Tax=Ranitomeya imitator TaxID=111125 RepID=A0ABN9MNW9_9NEOB|nr:unnamed protein product [Ranitomeya imitator]